MIGPGLVGVGRQLLFFPLIVVVPQIIDVLAAKATKEHSRVWIRLQIRREQRRLMHGTAGRDQDTSGAELAAAVEGFLAR